MIAQTARRVAISIAMLIATSLIIFIVLRLLPGDPVITRLGSTPGVDAAMIERLRQEAGLDAPMIQQYLTWIGGLVRGDFGQSYFNQFSVTELIGQRLPATLELTFLGILLAVIIALPLGVLASLRPLGMVDRIVTAFSTVGMALPQFLIGIALIIVFAVQTKLLPARGYTPFDEDPGENLVRMVLPALTLAIAASPLLIRYLRASMIEVLDSSYIRTATGKGQSRWGVVIGHGLRNALIPSLTMLGLIVGYTLGGVVIVEYVFGIPGLGSLAIDAVFKRDYAVLQSVVLLISAMFIITTLIVDLLYGVLDPRLRTKGRHG
ncbi:MULTISPECIES: ABC transporter permease [Microbacterium]|uniref:ABC transporter permease n=1 Tax=Microbacterium TaxID=33882 RepID=UPI001E41E5CE|nr:ABC transporter permease [Microbacterium nymphoidis]MCD2499539.1 ABC transporter permease [Microbacterium nymphoidis]